jgi:hypothetical protein
LNFNKNFVILFFPTKFRCESILKTLFVRFWTEFTCHFYSHISSRSCMSCDEIATTSWSEIVLLCKRKTAISI